MKNTFAYANISFSFSNQIDQQYMTSEFSYFEFLNNEKSYLTIEIAYIYLWHFHFMQSERILGFFDNQKSEITNDVGISGRK